MERMSIFSRPSAFAATGCRYHPSASELLFDFWQVSPHWNPHPRALCNQSCAGRVGLQYAPGGKSLLSGLHLVEDEAANIFAENTAELIGRKYLKVKEPRMHAHART